MGHRSKMWVLVLLTTIFAVSALAQPEVRKDPRREAADKLAHYALYDQAAAAYQKLLEADPNDTSARLALAEVYYRHRQFTEAEQECKAVIDGGTEAEKALAHTCLGDVYRKSGRREEARQSYEAAKALAEGKPGPEFSLARARVQRGLGFLDWEKAESEKTIVWFSSDSPVKNSAQQTAQFIDSRIAVIEKFSGHPFAGQMEIYYLNTPDHWKAILGDWKWWEQSPQEKTEYIVVGRTFFNLMRTLSFYMGNTDMKDIPKSAFIANGFAAGYSGSRTWGQRIREQTSQMKQQGQIPPLAELLQSTSPNNTIAALGASFVWHLTRTYGDEKFTAFWKTFNENEHALSEVYGKTVEEMQTEWHASIR